jgi:hypothetical protein
MLHEADSLEFARFGTLNLRYLDAVNEEYAPGNPLFKLRLANGMEESDAKAKLLLLANKACEISTSGIFSSPENSPGIYIKIHSMAFGSGLLEVSNGLCPYSMEFQHGGIRPTLPAMDKLEGIESFLESDSELSELFQYKNVFAISQHITAKLNNGDKIEALATEIKKELRDEEVASVLDCEFWRLDPLSIVSALKLRQTCLSLAGGEPVSDQDFAKLTSALAKIREAGKYNCSDTARDKILGIAKLCRMKDKIERAKVMADFCIALRDDGFLENFAQKAALHRSRMHEQGVFYEMPEKFIEYNGRLIDNQGPDFWADHLRLYPGQKSVTGNFAEYVEQNGGAWDLLEIFGQAQFVSSQSSLAVSVKTWLEEQREPKASWNAFYQRDDERWSPEKRARLEAGDKGTREDKVLRRLVGRDFRKSRNFDGPSGREFLWKKFSRQPKSYWETGMFRMNELKFGLSTAKVKEQWRVCQLSESLHKLERGESVSRADCDRHSKVITRLMDSIGKQIRNLKESNPAAAASIPIIAKYERLLPEFEEMKSFFGEIFDGNSGSSVEAKVFAKQRETLDALGSFIGEIAQNYNREDQVGCFVGTLDQYFVPLDQEQQGYSFVDESLCMLYAATQEILHGMDLPGKDANNGRITLYRRIDEKNFEKVFKSNGEGSGTGQIMGAAAYDSCSATEPIGDALSEWHGGHVLEIDTPLHRVFCTHLLGTLSGSRESFLGTDLKHEFVTMCNGLSATALPNVDTQDSQV